MKVKRTGWHQLFLHKPRPTGSVTARSCKNWRAQAFVRSLSIGLSSSTAVETFQNRNAITGQAGLSSLLYSRIVFFEKHEDIKAVAEAAGVATGDDEEVERLAAGASYFSSRVFCL